MTPTPTIPVPGPRRDYRAADPSPDLPPTTRVQVAAPHGTVAAPVDALPLTIRSPVDTPPPADYTLSRSLRSLLSAEPNAPTPSLPRVGDTFLGFGLTEELGRGAFARVYLARQQALAGRAVAVKVTHKPTREADRLAKLQHTNVVPVYSVHNSPPVQAICMPFLGRRTIVDALRAFRQDHPSGLRSGRRSTAGMRAGTTAVSNRSGPAPAEHSATMPRPALVEDDSLPLLIGDVKAVLRVLAGLAAGLAHAHDRHILHLDIKPANVLLADHGEPMLLDFNLSFDTSLPDRELVGGTFQYMAPEQLIDVRTSGHGGVDARTDLYSLGALGYEMLTGVPAFPVSSGRLSDLEDLLRSRRKGPPSLRATNPAVSPAVESIILKLLAPDPKDRYQSAEDLRADLERQLAHRPLLHAPNRSVAERFTKWRRRNPGSVVRFVAASLAGLLLASVVVAQRHESARAQAEAVIRARSARTGLHRLRLDLLLPHNPAAVERGRARAGDILKAYGLPDDPNWQTREAFTRLSEAARAELAGDLGEVLLLLAHTRWQQAKQQPGADLQAVAADALKLNRLARGCFGDDVPPLAVRQYLELAEAAGEKVEVCGGGDEEQGKGAPRTARGHFLDGMALVTAGRYGEAIEPLDQAISAQPDHAAAQFLLALCRHHRGEYARALERYDVARVLLPGDPRPFYYRGLVYGQHRKPDRAEAEFTRAIALDPRQADVYFDRAVARFQFALLQKNEADRLKKWREAEQDLTAGLENGASALQVRTLRARVRDALKDRAGADADRKAVRDLQPEREADYLTRGWVRIPTDPTAALADFEAASRINPRSIRALENQIHVLAEYLKDQPKALEVASRATEMFPDSAPLRANRAVLLARLGRRDEALREAEKARLQSDDPTLTYQLACVYAQTSRTVPADQAKAFALLRQAFRDGFRDVAMFDKDRDLAPVRKVAEFAAITRAARELSK